jgi:hypothetical protein
MKKPVIIVVLVLAVVATVGDVGFNLVGALQQIEALADGTSGDLASAAVWFAPRPGMRARDAAVVTPPARMAPADHRAQRTEPLVLEDAARLEFDSDGALQAAGERDPNLAELLNDPDPAIGNAVRDFVTQLDRPTSVDR